jgi:hypothetical protein
MAKVLQRRTWVHILVLALYTVLAVVLTWPLVRHLATHVPGSYTWAFDEYTFLWNTWWFRYSLFNLNQNPFNATYTFYPLGISLAFYTYNLFNAITSLPLQPFLPLPAISNLTFLFATVFSGYGTFLLVTYLLRSTVQASQASSNDNRSRTKNHEPRLTFHVPRFTYLAAFLSGLIYAFGSYRMVYAAIGHYNLWSTTWIPFYALFLIKTIYDSRRRNAILAGTFLVLALLCDMQLGVFLGMLTLIFLAFSMGRRNRGAVAGGLTGLLKRLAVMALVVLVLYWPILVPVLRETFGGYELAGWGDAERLSVDLMGLVTPTALHPLGGDWAETLRQTREGTSRFRDVNTVFLGWAGLALAVLGAGCYRRRLAAWITSGVIFAILSLGPLLQINGRSLFDLDGLEVNVPLPFILLHYIPLVKANRVPNRFSVVLMLCLAVLAGFGAYWLLKKVANSKRRATRVLAALGALLLATLVLFEHWSVPLSLTDARIPPVYEQIAGEADDADNAGAILQLPMGWRNGFGVQGAESTQTQYYQSYHQQRLLSGNISRNPPFKFDYFRQVPILDSLITLQTYGQVDAERRAADQSIAEEFVGFYDIRYVAVAPGVPGRPPYVDTRDAAVAYVEEVLPVERVYDQDGWLLYRVDQPPASPTVTLDLGSSELTATMALGEGWAGAEQIQGVSANWAVEQGARVFLPAEGGADYRLTVIAQPFEYPGAAEQAVTLAVNGHDLQPTTMSPGWETYTWGVPQQFLRHGLNEVQFAFDRLDAPADVLPGNGAIGGTGVQAPVAIEVNSGGPADFAFITVGTGDEAQDGSVHRPGYNVAVIHPQTGRVLEQRGFDTTPSGDEAEATALADFLANVPAGQIVVVALQGDGAALLTEDAVAAFRAIGGQADLRGTDGWSHAIIGVKGAAPGAAMEAAGPDNGWLRVAPDRRTLAVAVDAIVWETTDPRE